MKEQEKLVKAQKEEKRRVLIEKAPLVEVKLIDGDAFPQSELVKINAFGLVQGSKREDAEDHYVYFGSAKEMNGRIINDVICLKEDDFADQHFYIRYDKCEYLSIFNSYRQKSLRNKRPRIRHWYFLADADRCAYRFAKRINCDFRRKSNGRGNNSWEEPTGNWWSNFTRGRCYAGYI